MKQKQNWKEIIEAWKASGKSKLAFCKEREVSYQSFLMHFKRTNQDEATGFRQINLVGTEPSDRIDFHFPDGRCVSFPRETSKELIRFLVSL